MENADLSFASLLLALRHSTDDYDKKCTEPTLKPSLNFHQDFYRNSSYDNECSNAAESLTTLSSYSTDADSPMGSSMQSSSIGWKRRSAPCVSSSDVQRLLNISSMQSSIIAPRTFDFRMCPGGSGSGCGLESSVQDPISTSTPFNSSGMKDNSKLNFKAATKAEVKRICRPVPTTRSDLHSQRNQSKTRNTAKNIGNGIIDGREKEDVKETHIAKKNSREHKQLRKEVRESLKESKEAKEREKERERERDKSSLNSLFNICQTAEEKEADDNNEARLLKIARGRYKCSRCGALKTNHDCPIIEEYAGSVATQVERISLRQDEFLSGGMAGFSAALKTCNLLTVRSNYRPAVIHSPHSSNESSSSNTKSSSSSKGSSSNSKASSSSTSTGSSNNGLSLSLSLPLYSSAISDCSTVPLAVAGLGPLSRTPSFGSTLSRSQSGNSNGTFYNDTDNTTNSDNDNDSDSNCKSSSRKLSHAHESTDSETSNMPSLQPTVMNISPHSSIRLAASTHELNGLENKIGGLGVYSFSDDSYPAPTHAQGRGQGVSQRNGQKGAQAVVPRGVGKMMNTSTGMNIGPGHFSGLALSTTQDNEVKQGGEKRVARTGSGPGTSYHITYKPLSFSAISSCASDSVASPRDRELPLPL